MSNRSETAPLAGATAPVGRSPRAGKAPARVEAVVVEGEPVPVSARTTAILGTPSLVTLKHDTPGPSMRVRILRACGHWLEGDEPEVHVDYGSGLIENGLAEEI